MMPINANECGSYIVYHWPVADGQLTLPPKERLILELLVDRGPQFGLQLVDGSNGRLKRGTVYVTLGRLQQKGFIESEQEPPARGAIGLPRRIYRPTSLGVRALAAFSQLSRVLAWQDR
jgi:DNA-binding PadR family transcriptional regulator